jgi:DNA-directed RNA polymerase specialized sigma subunit
MQNTILEHPLLDSSSEFEIAHDLQRATIDVTRSILVSELGSSFATHVYEAIVNRTVKDIHCTIKGFLSNTEAGQAFSLCSNNILIISTPNVTCIEPTKVASLTTEIESYLVMDSSILQEVLHARFPLLHSMLVSDDLIISFLSTEENSSKVENSAAVSRSLNRMFTLKDTLISHNYRLVQSIIEKYRLRLSEDFFPAGVTGLSLAVSRFIPYTGVGLSVSAYFWCRKYIFEEISKVSFFHLPDYLRDIVPSYKRTVEYLTVDGGLPSDSAVSRVMNVNERTVVLIREYLRATVSMEDVSHCAANCDPDFNQYESLDLLSKQLHNLSYNERDVFVLHSGLYNTKRTAEMVADELSMSKASVRHHYSEAKKKLSAFLR